MFINSFWAIECVTINSRRNETKGLIFIVFKFDGKDNKFLEGKSHFFEEMLYLCHKIVENNDRNYHA